QDHRALRRLQPPHLPPPRHGLKGHPQFPLILSASAASSRRTPAESAAGALTLIDFRAPLATSSSARGSRHAACGNRRRTERRRTRGSLLRQPGVRRSRPRVFSLAARSSSVLLQHRALVPPHLTPTLSAPLGRRGRDPTRSGGRVRWGSEAARKR